MALATKDIYSAAFNTQADWGTFLAPDINLQHCANLNDASPVRTISGIQADFNPWLHKNAAFDYTIQKIHEQRNSIRFEDQCSAKYYFDIFNVVQASLPNINRIAEVGVYMGGSSCIFAGSIQNTNVELDLIDANRHYLQFTYERIRRLFPDVAARTRMFLGDLPMYVRNVMLKEATYGYMVHHDAAHMFNPVVRDLAALYYAKNKINALMIQDTHLRAGNINSYLFVDAALFAVFGGNLPVAELGIKFAQVTMPAFEYSTHGTYFAPDQAEGMYIPFENIKFRYPHPSISFESFFE